jgi:hypothetical protein
MKKIITIIFFCLLISQLLAFPTKATMVLFQPNSSISYLHILFLNEDGEYKYYELQINNKQDLMVSVTDSLFGKWHKDDDKILFFSKEYLKSNKKNKLLLRISTSNCLFKDSVCMKIVDECTLEMIYPELYRNFRKIDCVFSEENIRNHIETILKIYCLNCQNHRYSRKNKKQ